MIQELVVCGVSCQGKLVNYNAIKNAQEKTRDYICKLY